MGPQIIAYTPGVIVSVSHQWRDTKVRVCPVSLLGGKFDWSVGVSQSLDIVARVLPC